MSDRNDLPPIEPELPPSGGNSVADIDMAVIIYIAQQSYAELGFGDCGISVSISCNGKSDGEWLAGIGDAAGIVRGRCRECP